MGPLIILAVIVGVAVVAAIIFFSIAGSRKSVSAYLVPKDVESAARKVAGDADIVDAEFSGDGQFALKIRDSRGLTEMVARRHGEITVSISFRATEFPTAGTFAFRTAEADASSDPDVDPEDMANIRRAIADTLESKGFSSVGSEAPTLLVRYHGGYDEPLSSRKLDRMHGFISSDEDVDQSTLSDQGEIVFKQGSLIIDISDGGSDMLLWRAAGVADVSLADDLSKKKDRGKRAIHGMFKGFPPKGGMA